MISVERVKKGDIENKLKPEILNPEGIISTNQTKETDVNPFSSTISHNKIKS